MGGMNLLGMFSAAMYYSSLSPITETEFIAIVLAGIILPSLMLIALMFQHNKKV